MGGKITRPATSADLARAKFLKNALQQGKPSFTRPPDVPDPSPSEVSNQDTLALQRAFLEDLVECAPEAATVLENHVVTRVNAEFSRLFGFKPEEAIGRRIESLIVPPDRSSETSWIEENLRKGQKATLETKRQRKDGTQVDVFMAAAPVVIGGNKVASYLMYRDITDQKRAEAVSSALHRIAEKTSSAEDLQQFYAAIHAIVGELMYARNFYIAVYDPLTQLLSFPYFVDAEDPTPTPKQLGRGLTEYVLRTGEPLLCSPEVSMT
jgi:PAS domain S-box-containing protein